MISANESLCQLKSTSVNQVISKFEEVLEKKILYDTTDFSGINVSLDLTQIKSESDLLNFLDPFGFSFLKLKNSIVLIKGKSTESKYQQEPSLVMIQGNVKTPNEQEAVIGATVLIGEEGTATDTYGNFSFELAPGIYDIEIKSVGFETHNETITVEGNASFNFELFESTTQLNEIVISERAVDANVSSIQMSSMAVKLESIKELPTLLGEIDVFRIIQQVPGVSTVGEGTAGVNVRGGDVQENLVLLDNIPLFNGSHVFGFFSAINGDMLEGFELIKSGLGPAYGGRTSALLDMNLKTGDFNEWSSKIKASNILTSAVVEGPLLKEKASVMVGGRINYSDYLLATAADPEINRSSANFNDFGVRLMTKVGKRSNLSLSSYLSNDQFRFAADTTYNYSNKLLGLNWDYSINRQLSFFSTAYSSSYENNIEGQTPFFAYDYQSSIQAIGGKFQAVYVPTSSLELNGGVEITQYDINPDEISPKGLNDAVEAVDVIDDRSRELSAFVSLLNRVNNEFSFNAGLRYTLFHKLGFGQEYVFDNELTRSNTSVIDTVSYSEGETIQEYQSFEPRFSFVYRLSDKASIKGSYQRTAQFIHQLSNTVAPSPFAVWRVSNSNIKPIRLDQLSVGYFKNFKSNMYETSLEGYYKSSTDNLDYKNLADLVTNELIEADLLSVDGRSYGLEFLIRKNQGLLKGWLSYTYSRSEFRTNGTFRDEIINDNEYYLTHFDRPHILNSSVTLDLSRRWTFGFNFNFSSGRPVSFPTARYRDNGVQLIRFSERNSFRIADYHRLDFSITLKGNLKREQLIKSSWTFSVYNVYARNNAFSVFFGQREPFDAPFTPYQLAIIAIPVPSITWNIHIN